MSYSLPDYQDCHRITQPKNLRYHSRWHDSVASNPAVMNENNIHSRWRGQDLLHMSPHLTPSLQEHLGTASGGIASYHDPTPCRSKVSPLNSQHQSRTLAKNPSSIPWAFNRSPATQHEALFHVISYKHRATNLHILVLSPGLLFFLLRWSFFAISWLGVHLLCDCPLWAWSWLWSCGWSWRSWQNWIRSFTLCWQRCIRL